MNKIEKGIKYFFSLLSTVLLILLLIGVYFIYNPPYFFDENYNNCMFESRKRCIEMKGVVTKKYIDKEQHGYKMIELSDSIEINISNCMNNLYECIQVGTELYKPKGSLEVLIDGRIKKKIGCNCNEILLEEKHRIQCK